MKIVAFAVIASLCWAVATCNPIGTLLEKMLSTKALKCSFHEILNIKNTFNTLPDFAACNDNLSKSVRDIVSEQKDIINTCTEMYQSYENGCTDVSLFNLGCNMGMAKNGFKLFKGISHIVKLLNQINNSPEEISKCLMDNLRSYSKYFVKIGKNIIACFKK